MRLGFREMRKFIQDFFPDSFNEEIFLDSLIHIPALFRNDLTYPIAQDLDGIILRINKFT